MYSSSSSGLGVPVPSVVLGTADVAYAVVVVTFEVAFVVAFVVVVVGFVVVMMVVVVPIVVVVVVILVVDLDDGSSVLCFGAIEDSWFLDLDCISALNDFLGKNFLIDRGVALGISLMLLDSTPAAVTGGGAAPVAGAGVGTNGKRLLRLVTGSCLGLGPATASSLGASPAIFR